MCRFTASLPGYVSVSSCTPCHGPEAQGVRRLTPEGGRQSRVVVARKTEEQVEAMGRKTRAQWLTYEFNSMVDACVKAQAKEDREGVEKFFHKPSPKKEAKYSPGEPGSSSSHALVSPATAVSPGKSKKKRAGPETPKGLSPNSRNGVNAAILCYTPSPVKKEGSPKKEA